jgi:hypothetical protein
VAPGVAWGLWRPIFRVLEPALAAQLAVSGVCYQSGGWDSGFALMEGSSR